MAKELPNKDSKDSKDSKDNNNKNNKNNNDNNDKQHPTLKPAQPNAQGIVLEDGTYQCKINDCNAKMLNTKARISDHKHRHHNKNANTMDSINRRGGQVKCPECKKDYASVDGLIKHMRHQHKDKKLTYPQGRDLLKAQNKEKANKKGDGDESASDESDGGEGTTQAPPYWKDHGPRRKDDDDDPNGGGLREQACV
ncbi:hypothetical protein GGR57DRAFT_519552 [Xylariaceae sp. FL1272]|nr:hypothetical protein GGR57DRAFT_519552 [Xylariaceae sp. FL1272]